MNILIVKTSSLGDIVHAFSSLTALREQFPKAHISWVVEKPFSSLVSAHPYVDEVIEIDSKKWRKKIFSSSTYLEIKSMLSKLRAKSFDLLFDLQGNTKSSFVTFFAKSKEKVGYGYKSVWEYPNLLATNVKYDPPKEVNVREENLFLIKSHLKLSSIQDKPQVLKLASDEQETLKTLLGHPFLKEGQKILVAPGSHWKNKQASQEALSNLLEKIEQKKPAVFLLTWGNDAEKQFCNEISKRLPKAVLMEKISIPVLQNLMKEMDLVIAMDSLPLHLAATVGTATFGIFGPSIAKKFAPPSALHKAIQGSCPYGRSFDRRCPILRTCPTGACIKQLSGKTLYETLYGNE